MRTTRAFMADCVSNTTVMIRALSNGKILEVIVALLMSYDAQIAPYTVVFLREELAKNSKG